MIKVTVFTMSWRSKRLAASLLILLLCLTTQSGCWSLKELEDLAIVIAAGIDLDEKTNQIKLTAQIVRPEAIGTPQTSGGGGGGGQQQEPVHVTTATGETVFDAVRNMTFHTSRQLYWAHNEIVVIGSKLARRGTTDIIDVFVRNVNMRRQVWILVAEPSAEEVLKAKGDLEQLPGQEIARLVETRRYTSKVVGVTLHQFLNRLLNRTADPIATPIMIQQQDQDKRLHVHGAAVFNRDQLVGYLNGDETRGLMWAIDEVQGGVLIAECPEINARSTLEIIQSSSKSKAMLSGDKVTIELDIDTVLILDSVDTRNCPMDLTQSKTIKKLEQAVVNKIASDIQASLRKAKQLNADVFEFGELVHRSYPKEWADLEKRWDQLFQNLELKIQVNATVRSTSLTTKTIQPQ